MGGLCKYLLATLLRLLNGVFTGLSNATALIASQVPKDKSKTALGLYLQEIVAGTLTGPLCWRALLLKFWHCNVFLLVGAFLFLAAILTNIATSRKIFSQWLREAIPTKELFSSFQVS